MHSGVALAAAIGAQRCQTFTDEARSEGYVGVEGDEVRVLLVHMKIMEEETEMTMEIARARAAGIVG